MKSRKISTAILACALTLVGAGAASAATGPTGSGNAALMQYQEESNAVVEPPAPAAQVQSTTPPSATAEPSQTPAATAPAEPKQSATPPSTPPSSASITPVANVEPAAPVATSSRTSLPFTGYAVIPIALGGLALMTIGAVTLLQTRRRNH